METYTKAQIIEIIYRQQGDEEAIIKKLAEKVSQKISDEEFKKMVESSDLPMKELGYNRYYFA